MSGSGSLDPEFGQRAVFPIDEDTQEKSEAEQYILKVRQEALALPRVFRARQETSIKSNIDSSIESQKAKRPRHRPIDQSQVLDYDSDIDIFLIKNQTGAFIKQQVFANALSEIYTTSRDIAYELDVAQGLPTTRAGWKDYIQANEPVPVDHSTCFIILKYMSKWLSQRKTDQLAKWAWALALRLPSVLSGDEISVLRDVVRAIDGGNAGDDEDEDADSNGKETEERDSTQPENTNEAIVKTPFTPSKNALTLLGAFKHIVVHIYGQRDLR